MSEEMSKKALKKLEKEKQKQLLKEQKQQQQQKIVEDDPLKDNYGFYLFDDQKYDKKKFYNIKELEQNLIDQQILVRGRISSQRKVSNKLWFTVLRQQFNTLQCICFASEQVSKQQVQFCSQIPNESIVDIYGTLKNPEEEIKSTSCQFELQINRIYVVSKAEKVLPLQISDASQPYDHLNEDNEQNLLVSQKVRLDNRILDLRTSSKQAIFQLQSEVCYFFREFLRNNGFTEIHTPKLIEGSSEGGTNVFKFKYFDKDACLAQSPQLYKQMCLMADFDRVYEIGPVFRAENSFTPRHLCEFTGLDLEMTIKENYHELLDLMGDLFIYIFEQIEKRQDILSAIKQQFPFQDFVFQKPCLKLTFLEGVQLLKENGYDQDPLEDLDTKNEKKLGELVKNKYNTDFYMLHKYPKNARPFYTMLDKEDPNYTLSYDFFIRGQEITSGAQRVHDPEQLELRIKDLGLETKELQTYIDAFRYGSFPHGGCGIGLERVIFLYCNLGNIRNSCLYPRDPKRINP